MKFFRWLLSNILLIIIVVGLIYTYVYWGRLAGPDTPGGEAISYLSGKSDFVHNFVNGIKEKNRNRENRPASNQPATAQTVTASGENKSDHSTLTSGSASGTNATSENAPVGKATGNAASAALPPEEAVHNSTTLTQQPFATKPVATKEDNTLLRKKGASLTAPATIEPQKTAQKSHSKIAGTGTFVSPDVEAELEQAGAKGGVATLTPVAIRKIWIEARKSFYKHEYVQSEQLYKRVIAATRNNYDAYGELGNVYFYQGKNDKAADVYMKAALILIDSGQRNRARSLLGLMHHLNKDKAKLLEQKLEAAQ